MTDERFTRADVSVFCICVHPCPSAARSFFKSFLVCFVSFVVKPHFHFSAPDFSAFCFVQSPDVAYHGCGWPAKAVCLGPGRRGRMPRLRGMIFARDDQVWKNTGTVGWVERSEAHPGCQPATGWASHGSTHPTWLDHERHEAHENGRTKKEGRNIGGRKMTDGRITRARVCVLCICVHPCPSVAGSLFKSFLVCFVSLVVKPHFHFSAPDFFAFCFVQSPDVAYHGCGWPAKAVCRGPGRQDATSTRNDFCAG